MTRPTGAKKKPWLSGRRQSLRGSGSSTAAASPRLFTEGRLVEPAHVARLLPQALRHLREQLGRSTASGPVFSQPELF